MFGPEMWVCPVHGSALYTAKYVLNLNFSPHHHHLRGLYYFPPFCRRGHWGREDQVTCTKLCKIILVICRIEITALAKMSLKPISCSEHRNIMKWCHTIVCPNIYSWEPSTHRLLLVYCWILGIKLCLFLEELGSLLQQEEVIVLLRNRLAVVTTVGGGNGRKKRVQGSLLHFIWREHF